MFDVEALNNFYDDLSALGGMSVTDFHNRLAILFADDRSPGDLNDYRLGRNSWKKLRDEITPVSRFLRYSHINVDRIRFPLDDKTPDCWLLNVDSEDRGMEVTIERGRERFHLTKEMVENGVGRGFIGLQDDAPRAAFNERISNPRSMYTSEQALDATKAGIIRCLLKKNDNRYARVFYLLIQFHSSTLPRQRWSAIRDELTQEAASLPFEEVHVIGDADNEPWGFQIK